MLNQVFLEERKWMHTRGKSKFLEFQDKEISILKKYFRNLDEN